MSQDTDPSLPDSYDPKPYPQTLDGIELPWDDGLQRYCGHFSQRFSYRVNGAPTENTAANLIQLLGINVGRGDGRYADLGATDMAEFFQAISELDAYKRGEQPPRFWSEFSPDEKQAALGKIEEMVQMLRPEADPVMMEAMRTLGQELEN